MGWARDPVTSGPPLPEWGQRGCRDDCQLLCSGDPGASKSASCKYTHPLSTPRFPPAPYKYTHQGLLGPSWSTMYLHSSWARESRSSIGCGVLSWVACGAGRRTLGAEKEPPTKTGIKGVPGASALGSFCPPGGAAGSAPFTESPEKGAGPVKPVRGPDFQQWVFLEALGSTLCPVFCSQGPAVLLAGCYPLPPLVPRGLYSFFSLETLPLEHLIMGRGLSPTGDCSQGPLVGRGVLPSVQQSSGVPCSLGTTCRGVV